MPTVTDPKQRKLLLIAVPLAIGGAALTLVVGYLCLMNPPFFLLVAGVVVIVALLVAILRRLPPRPR